MNDEVKDIEIAEEPIESKTPVINLKEIFTPVVYDPETIETSIEEGLSDVSEDKYIYDSELGECYHIYVRKSMEPNIDFRHLTTPRNVALDNKSNAIKKEIESLKQKERTAVIYDPYNLESFFAAALITGSTSNCKAYSSISKLPINMNKYLWVGVSQRDRRAKHSLLHETSAKSHVVVGAMPYIPPSHNNLLDEVFKEVVYDNQRESPLMKVIKDVNANLGETYKLRHILSHFYKSKLSNEQALFMYYNINNAWRTLCTGEKFVVKTPAMTEELKRDFNAYISSIKYKAKSNSRKMLLSYNNDASKEGMSGFFTELLDFFKMNIPSKKPDVVRYLHVPVTTISDIPDYFWVRRLFKLTEDYVLNISSSIRGNVVSGDVVLLEEFNLNENYRLSSMV